jgi:AcrR family transcriptional regulator
MSSVPAVSTKPDQATGPEAATRLVSSVADMSILAAGRALMTSVVTTSAAAVTSTINQRPFTAATVGRRFERTGVRCCRDASTIKPLIDYGIAISNTAEVTTAQRVRRRYQSSHRETQARQTRRRIVEAAGRLFLVNGYAGSTIREIAAEANVSVPTVESLFGTKARVLKAAIDVAIAGDDDSVAVLDREWTDTALQAPTAEEFLSIVAGIIGPAQQRSAGLVLAVFEGASTDAELAQLATEMITQRASTADWLVDVLVQKAPLREGLSRQEAVDTMWILMDPAIFDRLTRHRKWTQRQYERWFAQSAGRLLIANPSTATPRSTGRRNFT